jgi:ppGpp synthetase/RelA/SpoT-type nucleotidyltranferase
LPEINEDLNREFHRRASKYARLKEEALFILEASLNRTEIKLHSVSSRIKTLDSFLEKVQKKQFEKPFDEIKDIVGVRVVSSNRVD